MVIRDYESKHYNITTGEEMIKIAENYLGDIARAAWEAFKANFPEKLAELVTQGNNIHNFTYLIHRIITGKYVNVGLTMRQAEAREI